MAGITGGLASSVDLWPLVSNHERMTDEHSQTIPAACPELGLEVFHEIVLAQRVGVLLDEFAALVATYKDQPADELFERFFEEDALPPALGDHAEGYGKCLGAAHYQAQLGLRVKVHAIKS